MRFVLLLTFTLSGCFERPRPSCAFLCGENGACPESYSCGADNRCHFVGADGEAETCDTPLPPDATVYDAPIDVTFEIDAPSVPIDATVEVYDASTADGIAQTEP